MKRRTQYLVDFYGKRMLMIKAHDKLTCGQCHPMVFDGTIGIGHDPNECVFKAFGVEYTVIKRLDRRTKLYKELDSMLPQFHAGMLRDIALNY